MVERHLDVAYVGPVLVQTAGEGVTEGMPGSFDACARR
jgi:hypothetical protein